MIKLVVTDLDGTFLNDHSEVSLANKETIRRLQAAGIKVCFASGRPYDGMTSFAKMAGLENGESYFITNTGACVYEYPSRRLISNQTLTMSDYRELFKYVKDYDVQVVGYGDDKLYAFSHQHNEALLKDQSILKMDIEVLDPNIDYDLEFGRFNVMGSPEILDEVVTKIPQAFLNNYYSVRNISFSFEIENKNAGKGNALVALANYLKLDLKTEVLTCGDNMNDLEMLLVTANSCSMGQSKDIIKRQTKYVTDTNQNDGFTKIVNKVIFNQK